MRPEGAILPEGWRYILPVWSATLLVLIVSDEVIVNLLLLLVSFATAYLFYIPKRTPFDTREDAIVSPVDGWVESVEKSESGVRVRIKKDLFGPAVVRSPVAGEVIGHTPLHGLFLGTETPKAFTLNEQASIRYLCGEMPLTMRVVCGKYALGLPARRHKGPVIAGEPQAILTDGIVELTMPGPIAPTVEKGERVRGGYSILGYGHL
ncbi:hypothetical protein [Hydrogenimonas urashimensis]|uniref:hypothetical protein n=1 Tax=Hydrogenimonas urashimensis TaxID=2740515 RepID=UPI0019154BF3|nr:hypothetical protein [Hydrogenimonas urashimensis]